MNGPMAGALLLSLALGFVALLLAISQIGGPLLILIWGGAAWWLSAQDQQLWGVRNCGHIGCSCR